MTNGIHGHLLRSIAVDMVIPPDGRLPATFQEAFGKRAKVVVQFSEQEQTAKDGSSAQSLMELAGKISAFQVVHDPVDYQRSVRDEWNREWDE